jgi:SAM-dependent methyltransferase
MSRPSASAAEAAAALEVIGRANLSQRRRFQAELLRQRLSELAALAAACGWEGAAVVKGGQPLVDFDGALLGAEPGHFRVSGASPAAILISTLEAFGIRPRLILDLQAGAGEVAILLARRYPRCRVIAVEPSRERLEAFEANVALQAEPLGNLEIAPPALAGGAEGMVRAMVRRRRFGCIDLLRCQAGADSAALAGCIGALRGRITLACVTLSGSASRHGELLDALEASGLVLLEKRSQPAPDPRRWLETHLSDRRSATCWFAARGALARAGRRKLRGGGRSRATPVTRVKAWIYGLLDQARQRRDPTDKRFEFEKLYALKPDPWNYLTNPYEVLKYRRTLQTALRLRPEARSALEVASSIGVFTRMLARSFEEVTATDVAAEALKRARRRVAGTGRVSYLRGDIRRLDTGKRHDIIFCAEMLYYLPDDAAAQVMRTLDGNLSPDGLVVTVLPHPFGPGLPDPFTKWHRHLAEGGLRLICEEDFDDPGRPYFIRAYERGDPGA